MRAQVLARVLVQARERVQALESVRVTVPAERGPVPVGAVTGCWAERGLVPEWFGLAAALAAGWPAQLVQGLRWWEPVGE